MDYIYDIETYPNCFTVTICDPRGVTWYQWEISDRKHEGHLIADWMHRNRSMARMVGFNNIGFDYPVIHLLYRTHGQCDAKALYDKAQQIIGAENRWEYQVYPSDRVVQQIDLYLIHHFDNQARWTSLKALEFNMRMDSVEDLPFPVGLTLTPEQMDILLAYNKHDVEATRRFYHETLPMIEFREALAKKYPGKDWINFNDTKIGKEYFIMRLEDSGVPCYEVGPDGRRPRQTRRSSIRLADAILPELQFETPQFQRVLEWLRGQTITETKGVFKNLVAYAHGMEFVFGLGGIHGSVESRAIEADEEYAIVDLDVTSYYPSLAISFGFHPEHLGRQFGVIYAQLMRERTKHPKGTAENAMLKLALNGVYGDSNNVWSPFYDPLFTMRITLNGQLLLCKLAEMLMTVSGVEMIQVNTDGLTIRCPRDEITMRRVSDLAAAWSTKTGLSLERTDYSRMFIADVNSYIAEYAA